MEHEGRKDAMYAKKKFFNKKGSNNDVQNKNEDRKLRRLKCFKCNKRGHKAVECKSTKTSEKSSYVSLLSTDTNRDHRDNGKLKLASDATNELTFGLQHNR